MPADLGDLSAFVTDAKADDDANSAHRRTCTSGGEITETMLASIPAGRYGRAEELADVVTFLASARASFVTGVMLRVAGGAVQSL